MRAPLLLTARHLVVPMREVFEHAAARRTTSELVLVRVDLGDQVGVGESAPRPYVTGETPASALAAVGRVDLDALGACAAAPDYPRAVAAIEALDLAAGLGQGGARAPAAACAIELALLDLAGRRHDARLADTARALGLSADLLRGTRPRPGPSRACDLSRSPEDFVAALQVRPALVKVKVGRSLDADLDRVARLRRLLPEDVPILADANMAWTPDIARAAVPALRARGVAWFEEPLARGDLEGCAALRAETGARLLLDESVTSLDEARRAIEIGAADGLNLRLSKTGGLISVLRIFAHARQHGLSCFLGVQVGQSGLGAAATAAAADAAGPWIAHEGATSPWTRLTEPLVVEPVGHLEAGHRGPGLGITPHWETIDRATVAHLDLTERTS